MIESKKKEDLFCVIRKLYTLGKTIVAIKDASKLGASCKSLLSESRLRVNHKRDILFWVCQ